MSRLKIGLTGGIAAGKSQVCRLFADKGAPIIDADQIAKDLLAPNSPLLVNLKEKFGSGIFLKHGELNRKALGKIVFNSDKELTWLNQLLHPAISQQMARQLTQLAAKTHFPYVILDIPLLINLDGKIPRQLQPLIDRVLVVSIELPLQIQRLCERDNLGKTQALAIVNQQSSLQQKRKLADDIIDNNGSLSDLESQVSLLHNQYLKLAKMY